HNVIETTLEISSTKWPSYSAIPGFWADNRESMFWYISAVHKGIYGTVTDAATGEPLNATIEIEGIDKQYFTDPDLGDYYRLLKPGTYTITVSADDYFPQTIENITVTDDTGVFKEATEVNVQLLTCVGINDDDPIPEGITLEQNYPNPFNPSTEIIYNVDKETELSLSVYDHKGNIVKEYASEKYAPGRHKVEFNGEGLSSGVYYYILRNASGSMSGKMLMLK
ncbi:MAG TPA: carboxypeptidase regulatory-like domain-containing protein, partial [Clostridiales bacterium]|nr:carboxypeptidase regulatory-like domain-containing protein [Clostridiales bacterium]